MRFENKNRTGILKPDERVTEKQINVRQNMAGACVEDNLSQTKERIQR
jgi:hypothetical protein